MTDIPDSVIHWVLGGIIPLGGALFLFLLKRTFKDFEDKLASLFLKLEASLKQSQEHDTRIQLIEYRVTEVEKKVK